MATRSTGFPDVDVAIREQLAGLQALLGERLVGLYVHGSLALGDFAPTSSDIDLLVVTRDELADRDLDALRRLHEAIDAGPSPWAREVEVSYLPLAALRRYDPARTHYPHVGRGGEGLQIQKFDHDWVVQLHILREHGVAIVGPLPAELVDPISAEQRRQAARALARRWLPELLAAPPGRFHRGYQVFVVLSVCRILQTAATGDAASKPAAAAWALSHLPARWRGLVERATAWSKSDPPDISAGEVDDMRAFARDALSRAEASG